MALELKSCEIIGVDLENNHTQSYNGFTCLIQLSTYDFESGDIKTYVVDVLVEEVAANLVGALGSTIFENPNVLKLLHGSFTSDL